VAPAPPRGGGAAVVARERYLGTLDGMNPVLRGFLPGIVLVIVSVVVAATASPYWSYLGFDACYTALLVLSAGLVFGQAGMLSLCPMSFAAVGTWVDAYFGVDVKSIPFPVVLVIAMAVAVPIGAVIGLLAIRLRGMHLAIATLALAQITTVLLALYPIPGSNDGQLTPRPSFAASQQAFFLLSVVVLAIICGVTTFLIRGRLGATWSMLREERASAGAGKNVLVGKLTVFCISAAIAAAAGVLLMSQSGSVAVVTFSPAQSLLIVVLAMFLGGGTSEGAVTGGLFGAFGPWLFNELLIASDLPNLFFAYGAVDILSKFPAGISPANQQRRRLARSARNAARAGQAIQVTSVLADAGAGSVDTAGTAPAGTAPADPGGPALTISGLTVRYGAFTALSDVSLTVPARSVVGLIGPNGAGKTTLIDAVSGFARYTGTVGLRGRDLAGLPPHRRVGAGLRRTFQQSRVSEDLSVLRYMAFVGGSGFDAGRARTALEFLAVPWPERYLGEMDVPTRRLVEVAAVIAAAPAVALLDEPAAGLGERESTILSEQLARVPEVFGTAVLLVEHDMGVVRSVCDVNTVLDYGLVIAAGATAAVLACAVVRRAYLGLALYETPAAGRAAQEQDQVCAPRHWSAPASSWSAAEPRSSTRCRLRRRPGRSRSCSARTGRARPRCSRRSPA
jgi:branched-chain amino acid transport system permease protein